MTPSSLDTARDMLAKLEDKTAYHNAHALAFLVEKIHDRLLDDDLDAAALDPTGQSTAAQMEARIAAAARDAATRSARAKFNVFEHTQMTHSETMLRHAAQDIRDLFNAAGATAAVLDPTGQSTAAQMEARIETVIRTKAQR